MRRPVLILAILIVSFGLTLAQADEAQPAPTTGDAQPSTCQSRTAAEIVEQWKAKVQPMAIPDCPEESDTCNSKVCGGITPCQTSSSSSSVDTGFAKCFKAQGELFNCNAGGATVHLTTTACVQCPCCTAEPRCLCPLDCGEVVALSCQ